MAEIDQDCALACAGQDAEQLNASCFCAGPELEALENALEAGSPEVAALIGARCPHLFSALPVFASSAQMAQMRDVINAIETVIALPAWHTRVLANAPSIARFDSGVRGVFFGYDFHLADDTVGLIEINTNAGGALLNAALARAQQPCAALDAGPLSGASQADLLEQNIIAMFRSEWSLGDQRRTLRTVAIVDSDPERQYLYPEFLLFRQLFRRNGIEAVIADPARLRFEAGALWCGDLIIDLVYNRLTDFALEQPDSLALRQAYLARAAVVTPNPRAHALYADKRSLVALSDPAQLETLGVPEALRKVLTRGIPRTEVVTPELADELWQSRRQWFFKPVAGFGGRAAYRGDKLTKRVWEEILAGDYVAQAIVAPSARTGGSQDAPDKLKFDIRSYCYAGQVQWTAARVYQGQTTNFRTPGGGFAMVYSV